MPNGMKTCGSSFDDMTDHVWSMMNDLSSPDYFGSHAPRSWRPRVNLYETQTRYVVCVALSGMSVEQIDIQADDGVLKIRGDRSRPTVPDEADQVCVHVMEIDSGSFSRKIPILPDVDREKISATYANGYLWVFLPRTGASAQGKQT